MTVRDSHQYLSRPSRFIPASSPSQQLATQQPTGLQLTPASQASLQGTPVQQYHPPALQRQQQAHKRAYACRVCGEWLSSASNRIRHERAKHKEFQAGGISVAGMKRTTTHMYRDASGESGPRGPAVAHAISQPQLQAGEDTMAPSAAVQPHGSDAVLMSVPAALAASVLLRPAAAQPTAVEPAAVQSRGAPAAAAVAVAASPSVVPQGSGDVDRTPTDFGDAITGDDAPSIHEYHSLEGFVAAKEPATSPPADDGVLTGVDGAVDNLAAVKDGSAEQTCMLQEAAFELEPEASSDEVSDSEEWRSKQQSLLSESDLQRVCHPFLQWLTQPPMTQCEALVKGRARIQSLSQLQPIKNNLRFIFAVLAQRDAIQGIELQALTKLATCQALWDVLVERRVGSARIHAIFLLVKKVLVHLSSQESVQRRQFILPSTAESFIYVDHVCANSSQRRKQETRNRALLGVQAAQQLKDAQPQVLSPPFEVPTSWSPPRTATASSGMPSPTARLSPSNHGRGSAADSSASSSPSLHGAAELAAAGNLLPSANELSTEELKKVAAGCLAYFKRVGAATADEGRNESAGPSLGSRSEDQRFMRFLVTATLCLGLAPRSQVLKQLRIGSTLKKEADGRYWVKMLAEFNKNGKPTTVALPIELTAPYDTYLATVRPRLLLQQQHQQQREVDESHLSSPDTRHVPHDYLFFKKSGAAPRSDFSELTALVAQELLGRPVNAHAFRAAVITAYYQAGASQGQMDVLASIMAHDSTTAKHFYFKPLMTQAAVETNKRMMEVLQLE